MILKVLICVQFQKTLDKLHTYRELPTCSGFVVEGVFSKNFVSTKAVTYF